MGSSFSGYNNGYVIDTISGRAFTKRNFLGFLIEEPFDDLPILGKMKLCEFEAFDSGFKWQSSKIGYTNGQFYP